MEMALNNLRLENRKGEMLDVQTVVVMQETTKTLQFLSPNLCGLGKFTRI